MYNQEQHLFLNLGQRVGLSTAKIESDLDISVFEIGLSAVTEQYKNNMVKQKIMELLFLVTRWQVCSPQLTLDGLSFLIYTVYTI